MQRFPWASHICSTIGIKNSLLPASRLNSSEQPTAENLPSLCDLDETEDAPAYCDSQKYCPLVTKTQLPFEQTLSKILPFL